MYLRDGGAKHVSDCLCLRIDSHWLEKRKLPAGVPESGRASRESHADAKLCVLGPFRQRHHVTLLLFLRNSVHHQELLSVLHIRIQAQQSTAGVYFKCIRILVERLIGRRVAVDKHRHIHAGSGALSPLRTVSVTRLSDAATV